MILRPPRPGCVAAILITASLTACAPRVALDDTIRPRQLAIEKRGVALLVIDVDGGFCTSGAVHLSTKERPGNFRKFAHYALRGSQAGLLQIDVPEGTYHVGFIACIQQHRVVDVGTHTGSVVIGDPLKSMGRFTVAAGEIVNAGHLSIVGIGGEPAQAKVYARPMVKTDLEALTARVPKLATQAVNRPLVTVADERFDYRAALLPVGGGSTPVYVPVYRSR